jgi:hypothetical protein
MPKTMQVQEVECFYVEHVVEVGEQESEETRERVVLEMARKHRENAQIENRTLTIRDDGTYLWTYCFKAVLGTREVEQSNADVGGTIETKPCAICRRSMDVPTGVDSPWTREPICLACRHRGDIWQAKKAREEL